MKNWPLWLRMAAFASVVAVLAGTIAPSASIPAGVVGAVLYMQFDSFMQRRRAATALKAQAAIEPTRSAPPPPSKRASTSKRVTAPGSKPVTYRKKR